MDTFIIKYNLDDADGYIHKVRSDIEQCKTAKNEQPDKSDYFEELIQQYSNILTALQPYETHEGTLSDQSSFFMSADHYSLEEQFYIKELLLYGNTQKVRANLNSHFEPMIDNGNITGFQFVHDLKELYPKDSYNHSFSDGMTASIDRTSKGLTIHLKDSKDISLSWINMMSELVKLIQSGEFEAVLIQQQESIFEYQDFPFTDTEKYSEFVRDRYEDTIQAVAANIENYHEPFVVFHLSGNENIRINEKIPFWEADQHLKEVEAQQIKDLGRNSNPYHETIATVFYRKTPDDQQLSSHWFTYDLGVYPSEISGIYTHIKDYNTYLDVQYKQNPNMKDSPLGSRKDVPVVKEMLEILDSHRQDHSQEVPQNETATNSVEKIPNTIEHRNYKAFKKMFRQMADGTYNYMKFEAGEGFDPLSIQTLYNNQISIRLTFVKDYEVMFNPEIVFEVDHNNQTISPYSYRNTNEKVYQSINHDGYFDKEFQDNLSTYLSSWLNTIENQQYKLVKATGNEKEFIFDSNGKIIPEPRPETMIDTPENSDVLSFPQNTSAPSPAPIIINGNYDLDNIDLSVYQGGDVVGYSKAGFEFRFIDVNHNGRSKPYINSRPVIDADGNITDDTIPDDFQMFMKLEYERMQKALDIKNYSEPFVIITKSNNPLFEESETIPFQQLEQRLFEANGQKKNKDKIHLIGNIYFKDKSNASALRELDFNYSNKGNPSLYQSLQNRWTSTISNYVVYSTRNNADVALNILKQYTYDHPQPSVQESKTKDIKPPEELNAAAVKHLPVFIEDVKALEKTLDFDSYANGEIIGYTKNGVQVVIHKQGDVQKFDYNWVIDMTGKVQEDVTIPKYILEQIPKYQYHQEKPNNPDTRPYAAVNRVQFEGFDQYVNALCKNVKDYKEPLVVVDWSDNTEFAYGEILTYAQADKKIKEVEKQHREDKGHYNEESKQVVYPLDSVKGSILYLDKPDDEKLSSYLFRYVIGELEIEASGLSRDTLQLWREEQGVQLPVIHDAEKLDRMFSILEKYSMDSQVQNSPAAAQPQAPAPIFFEQYKDIQKDLDLSKYNSGDVIGYDAKGVQYSVSKTDTYTFINTETMITPMGDILGYNNVPEHILEQIKAHQNNNHSDQEESTWKNETAESGNAEEKQTMEQQSFIETTTAPEETVTNAQSNFTIQAAENINLASGKTKYRFNIAAIQLLIELESSNRTATTEEQAVLAKYGGFGGIPQAFDRDNESWATEYQELKELLTEKEYNSTRASTLNAHFTDIDIVNAMYKGIQQLGFQGGNILEPAMGTGNFFGAIPEELKDKSKLYGVELDDITGRIAKQLYPQAKIEIGGFEDTQIPNNFFDMAIGNVPFGNYKVHDTKFNSKNFQIHDYFFAKAIDQVRPNGVVAFITSKGTMDKSNPSFRKYMAERAELLGAIRLPNNAFKASANTEVTTDILFFKKRDKLIDPGKESWIHTGYYNTGKMNEEGTFEQIPLNQYFIDNPHMMLGEMKYDKSRYGNDKETALHPFSKPEDLPPEEQIAQRFALLRQRNEYNEDQLLWLERFEKSAIAKGSFEKEFLTTGMYVHHGGIVRMNDIFDGKLLEMIDFVNKPTPDKSQVPLKELLAEAITYLPENVMKEYASIEDLEEKEMESIPADPTVKNYSYTVVNDRIYQRENAVMYPLDVPDTVAERMKMLIQIRDATVNIIDLQLEDCTDQELQFAQHQLNSLYDTFTKKFKSHINTPYNIRLFGDDAEFPLISSLEDIQDDGKVLKADIFTKRTIQPYRKIERAETSLEALTYSLYEKGCVDLPYMAELTNKEYEEIIDDLEGMIFKNPLSDNLDQHYDIAANWETADEYLSGNVVEKWETAKEYAEENPIYQQNVKALQAVQPIPLEAHEISAGIGSRWIDEKYYAEFINEHFKPSSPVQVQYFNQTNEWHVSKPSNRYDVIATQVYGTEDTDAYKLMETLLNQRSPKVWKTVKDEEGKDKQVLNKDATLSVKDKAKGLQEEFQKWIFDDLERRKILVDKYNQIYNTDRVRQFDGSFLRFEGMNPFKELRDYQKNAVARILFGGNTLLAHVVGAGKTYTMIAGAMEMKRMGLANKPMIVVPNHLVNQFTNEFKTLYPAANILAATTKDFEKPKRQRFCARAATGEWDAIIIGHSSFGMIPVSQERQQAKLEHDIQVAREGLAEVEKNSDSDKVLVKEMERTIRRLETKLKNLMDKPKDNVINFENLGVDALFVDEADLFKNKYIFTKMGNVAGLSKTASDKSTDMELKCDFINEQAGAERNVVFATGTPISNSIVECYVMESYLMKKELERLGLEYFDNWKAQFAEVVTALELDVSGKGFRMRDRLAKYKNLPDLLKMFWKIADIKTAEDLNLPVPEIETGKPVIAAAEASPAQKVFVDALVELSYKISQGEIPPEHYNMLCVTNDGRLGALDLRAVNLNKFRTLAERYDIDIDGLVVDDFANSKVNECIHNTYEIYKDTETDKLTQMIFCDVSTPKHKRKFDGELIKEKLGALCEDWGFSPEKTDKVIKDFLKTTATKTNFSSKKMQRKIIKLCRENRIGSAEAEGIAETFFKQTAIAKKPTDFSVYDDIKEKLIAKGVNPREIAFIHDADSDVEKEALFSRMRSGDLRILIGSTAKMGAGTNAQKKLIALHNLDCPWRPRDIEQRIGRIVRQGNLNPSVKLFNYVTEGTFDAYLWQIIETKQRYISQIMSGKITTRTMDDIDTTTMNYAEVKAIATGNPLIVRKAELEAETTKLKTLQQRYTATRYSLQDKALNTFPNRISRLEKLNANYQKDIQVRDTHTTEEFSMQLGSKVFTEPEKALKIIMDAAKLEKYQNKTLGNYKGFDISVQKAKDIYENNKVILTGANVYTIDLSDNEKTNFNRIEKTLSKMEQEFSTNNETIADTKAQLADAKAQLEKPFEYERDLIVLEHELSVVYEKLDIGKESKGNLIADESKESSELAAVFSEEIVVEEEIEIEDLVL